MAKSNTRVFILALCVLIVLMGVVLFSAVGSGFPGRIVQQSQSNVPEPQQPNKTKRVNQQDAQGRSLSGIEEIKSRFPKVDYDAPEPTDPAERTKRRNKGKHFDNGYVSKDPTHYSSGLISHWDQDLPALPVAESSAVLIAHTITRGAFLSNDKSGVYTELSVKVEGVFKSNNDLVTKGSTIDINRLGGVVRYRTGEESFFLIVGQNMPIVGKRYLFFLKAIKDSQDFEIITGYELGSSGVKALDSPSQFTQYNGSDEATFLNSVRSAIAEHNKTGNGNGG